MTRRPVSRLALLLLLSQLASGCSLAFMNKAQEPVVAPNYPVDCTSSMAAPVLDSICAGYFVANGIYWASQTACDGNGYQVCSTTSSQKTTGPIPDETCCEHDSSSVSMRWASTQTPSRTPSPQGI